ncbi:hypothetical protein GGG16DRAFT_33192, partial [Schizophyllum commune]
PMLLPIAEVDTPQSAGVNVSAPPPRANLSSGPVSVNNRPLPPVPSSAATAQRNAWTNGQVNMAISFRFITFTLPVFIYHLLLFQMPRLYFGRVARVLSDAGMTMDDLDLLGDTSNYSDAEPAAPHLSQGSLDEHQQTLQRFRASWTLLINNLSREWKTQNIISVLLLRCGLYHRTCLQTDHASSDAVTRTACLLSLIAALMSLLYGGLYIIRFGTMNRRHKAYAWAMVRSSLLAPDLTSILFFVIAIMSFIWRTGSVSDPVSRTISERGALALRITTTSLLALGLLYLCAMIKTFARYG